MKNIFSPEITTEVIDRIHRLTPSSSPLWGKMSVGQMMAHCCVSYEMIFENNHSVPGAFKRTLLRLFLKNIVTSEKPYGKNNPTAPQFLIKEDKDFDSEKKRLIGYIGKTQELGEKHFLNIHHPSFGKLTVTEWNNLFYKHLDHHLKQFGV